MRPDDLPKPLRKYAALIASVSDERGSGDGYWVYYVEGLIDSDGTHGVHEDSPTECARAIGPKPCYNGPKCCQAEKVAAAAALIAGVKARRSA